jgi:hypothetical protein
MKNKGFKFLHQLNIKILLINSFWSNFKLKMK